MCVLLQDAWLYHCFVLCCLYITYLQYFLFYQATCTFPITTTCHAYFNIISRVQLFLRISSSKTLASYFQFLCLHFIHLQKYSIDDPTTFPFFRPKRVPVRLGWFLWQWLLVCSWYFIADSAQQRLSSIVSRVLFYLFTFTSQYTYTIHTLYLTNNKTDQHHSITLKGLKMNTYKEVKEEEN